MQVFLAHFPNQEKQNQPKQNQKVQAEKMLSVVMPPFRYPLPHA